MTSSSISASLLGDDDLLLPLMNQPTILILTALNGIDEFLKNSKKTALFATQGPLFS